MRGAVPRITDSQPVTEQAVGTRAMVSRVQEHARIMCFLRRREEKTRQNNTETNYEGVQQIHFGPAHALL